MKIHDIVLAFLMAVLFLSGCSTTIDTQETTERIKAEITRVVDGDTMKVAIGDKEETIRLLLVDTPETKHPDLPVQPFGPEASQFAKEQLENKQVQLELDVSERDKYGRLLVYLWKDDVMFNELLLQEGLARVAYVYPPNIKYVDQFREIQQEAQQQEIGIWSIENYATEDGYDVQANGEESKADTEPKLYQNCTEARAAGVTPLYSDQPGYHPSMDGDGDGIACE